MNNSFRTEIFFSFCIEQFDIAQEFCFDLTLHFLIINID